MKRILHVVSCLERGGTEAFLMNHYRCLNRQEYQFDFLVLHPGDYPHAPEIRALGGRIFFVQSPSLRQVGRFLREAAQVMEANGPYLAVHSHINIENAWILYAARKAGVPVRVSHSHDTIGKEGRLPVRVYRALQEALIKTCATDFLACSRDAGDYLYGSGFFRRRGRVIRNGIDVERFRTVPARQVQALRASLDLEDAHPVIGNITRFEPKKNQAFALEVFAHVLKQEPRAALILGGPDGGSLARIRQRARELGLEHRVRFIGPRSDIPVCLKLLDGYLFPSLYEGLGIVLLEAQASGCFCLASTGVSAEADVGLGAVCYLDLQTPPEIWADRLRSGRGADAAAIPDAFRRMGYSIQDSLVKLLEVYEKR